MTLTADTVPADQRTLVMIEYGKRLRAHGMPMPDPTKAAAGRFRPVVLITLDSFCGLMPINRETSVQVKLMIPMAISPGYGILAVTTISLFLVPCIYSDGALLSGMLRGRTAERTIASGPGIGPRIHAGISVSLLIIRSRRLLSICKVQSSGKFIFKTKI